MNNINVSPELEICKAYQRQDGGKGIRNKILVIYTVECSKHVAESIAIYYQEHKKDVDVIGSLACLDNQVILRRLIAFSTHPNVGGILVVGHGCEYLEPSKICDFARAHGRLAESFYIQDVGGTEAGIRKGKAIVDEMLNQLKNTPKIPMFLKDLVIGAKCGGSDFTSGLTGNVIIGRLFEELTANEGTAMMEEMAEAVGVRDYLVSRAINSDVARDVGKTYDKTMEFCKRLGHYSISPGNFNGGITTIEEKSMGAVVKMGNCKIQGVLKIAQKPRRSGFWYLDVIPDYNLEPAFFYGGDATGLLDQAACGCHLLLFNTGRGYVGGTPIVPVIKMTGNQETFNKLPHDIDLNVSGLLSEREMKDAYVQRLWQIIIRICQGEQCDAEKVGHRQGTLFFNYQNPCNVVDYSY